MNWFTLSIFLASLLAAPVVQAADEEDHAAHHPGADQSQADPAQDDKAAGMKMDKMQEKMKKMREQMEKIHSAKNPQERQKLMQEHMQSMQESMKMMSRMGAGMKSGDMMAKAKKDPAESMTDAGDGMGMCMMMKKQKSVESRMDMMQQMMEQMMEHESAEQEMERGR
jgi:coenzyme F420-reducing hydrogenase delta subunit